LGKYTLKSSAWGGRFSKNRSGEFTDFSASIDFDRKLATYDIRQNKAQAKALAKAKLLTKSELSALLKGLGEIEKEIVTGKFRYRVEDEDIHMNIERRLKEKAGAAAGKIHTGRSRNDQVATDLRLYVKENSAEVAKLLVKLQKILLKQAEKHLDHIMPAYTHLQMAQPVRIGHWFLAYLEMFGRDRERFLSAMKSADVMPLGSGALAGNNFGIDRKFLAREIGFSNISQNSIDAVSDRDFALDFCYAASGLFIHLSRLSEELIIFSSSEFGVVKLPDELCTGSSIMPQKKNPDLPELLRGKTGRIAGNLTNLLTLMKGLPLAYNRDMQEDKMPVFDSCEQVLEALPLVMEMVGKMKFNTELLKERTGEGFITAVDLADYLVIKGVPFRDAHHVVGKIVAECEKRGKRFTDMTIAEFQKHSPQFAKDVFGFADPSASPDRKKGTGSTSRTEILKQIKRLKSSIR
jgi:argininosuccinate lyase